jgi:hypothetical protein
VNSSFSGVWVQYVNRFVVGTTTLVISRALGTEEIYSFSDSGLGRFRGGFLKLCRESHLPSVHDSDSMKVSTKGLFMRRSTSAK